MLVPATPVTLPPRSILPDEDTFTLPPVAEPIKPMAISCDAFKECWKVTIFPTTEPHL
jgi:hypothetical protein